MQQRILYIYAFIVCAAILGVFLVQDTYGANKYELLIAQGIQRINEKQYTEALDFLKKALELSPDNSEAIYYTAISFSRLGELDEAEKLFLKILNKDESYTNVYFELGRIYHVFSKCDRSAVYLSNFILRSDNATARNIAEELMDSCKKVTSEKPYGIDISAGGQYDDNVVLEPENPVSDAERKSDARALLYLSAHATLLKNDDMKLKADYVFYQSVHRHLYDFNVQYHSLGPALEKDLSENIKATLGYRLGYTTFGGARYNRVNTFSGKVKLKSSDKLSTIAIYEYNDNKFWDGDLFPTSSDRIGHKATYGVKQDFYLEGLKGDIHYYSDFERTEKSHWAYDGSRLGAAILYRIAPSLYISLSGDYNRRKYKDDYPGTTVERLDKNQQYSVKLVYMLSGQMSISLMDSYSINDSNLSSFEYRRNISGLFLTVGVL